MAKLFNKNPQNIDKNSPAYAVQQYLSARSTNLSVILFSLINFILFFVGADVYFLFSATIPYYVAVDLLFFFGDIVGIVCCLGTLALYFLCWLFSKKNPKWMIVTTVLFSIDCLVLIFYIYSFYLYTGSISNWILDIIFHVFIMLSLIGGLRYSKKYKESIDENGNVSLESNNEEISQTENNTVISENTENTENVENTEQ